MSVMSAEAATVEVAVALLFAGVGSVAEVAVILAVLVTVVPANAE